MERKIDKLHDKVDTLHAKLNRISVKINELIQSFKIASAELDSLSTCYKGKEMKSCEFIIEHKIQHKGTYAGLRFADESVQKLLDFANENNIPNILDKNKFHSTLLYSQKYLPNYKAHGDLQHQLTAYPTGFEIWVSPANAFKEDDTNCLVLTYKCQEQEDRFNELMDIHQATYDFDEYKPHTTISYDVGPDFNESNLDASLIGELFLVKEYAEELNLDKTF